MTGRLAIVGLSAPLVPGPEHPDGTVVGSALRDAGLGSAEGPGPAVVERVLDGPVAGTAMARAVEMIVRTLEDERVTAVVLTEKPAAEAVAIVFARAGRYGDWPRVYAEILATCEASGVGPAAEAALCQARLSPAGVDYLDLGPASTAELAELAAVYRFAAPTEERLACLLGSIGRHGGALGRLAGLARCLHAGQVPAPPPGLDRMAASCPEAAESVFAVAAGDQPWLPRTGGGRRIAALNTVSSSGDAAHLVLASAPVRYAEVAARTADLPMLLPIPARDPGELAESAARLRRELDGGADLRALVRDATVAAEGRCSRPYRAVLVAVSRDELLRELSLAARDCPGALERTGEWATPAGSYCTANPMPPDAGVVFVYPGTYATYPRAGSDLFPTFPELRRRFETTIARPADMLCVRSVFPRGLTMWDKRTLAQHERALVEDVTSMMTAGVSLGVLHAWLLRDLLGIRPDAALGYSLGEISMLFAHDVWRPEPADDSSILATPLFRHQLHRRRTAARDAWRLPADMPDERVWATRVLFVDAREAAARAAESDRVFITHVNTPHEVVIGGLPEECEELTRRLGCLHVELPAAPVLHCPLVRPFFGELADVSANRPPGRPDPAVKLFTADGFGTYHTDDQAAVVRTVTTVLRDEVDFPGLVRAAHEAGHRYFVEMGPGALCSRWIRETLTGVPHVAVSVDRRDSPKGLVVAQALARLVGSGLDAELSGLWPPVGRIPPTWANNRAGTEGPAQEGPIMFEPDSAATPGTEELITLDAEVFEGPRVRVPPAAGVTRLEPVRTPSARPDPVRVPARIPTRMADPRAALGAMVLSAHRSALRAQAAVMDHSLRALEVHSGQIEDAAGTVAPPAPPAPHRHGPWRLPWDHTDLVEFADGSAAAVLGDRFADADTFVRRVRLPSPPYLFLSRVISLDSRFGAYEPCTIISEYDLPDGIWALDGQLRPGVWAEVMQGCLPLLASLGIDLRNRGRRSFRALGGTSVFSGLMPVSGQTIRIESNITRFLWEGEQLLFFLDSRCMLGDEVVQETLGAQFGLFSRAELDSSSGIVDTEFDRRRRAALPRRPWFKPLARTDRTSLSWHDLELLSRGRAAEVFGPQWNQSADGANPSIRLPAREIMFFDEVTAIDPRGGPAGLGEIVATKHVTEDDWYFRCHFPDDPVLPASFCLEGVNQLLQVYAMYLGLHLVLPDARFQPVPGLRSDYKTRGQITPGRRLVRCVVEVTSVTLVDRPTVIADAMLYDGDKPIMRVYDLGLQLREKPGTPYRPERGGRPSSFLGRRNAEGQPALVNEFHMHHLAEGDYGIGGGSEFEVFRGRKAFRLPNRDFLFLDRIMDFTGERHEFLERVRNPRGDQQEALTFVTEYDCAPDAWYHEDNSLAPVPNFVLMETALQAAAGCGCYLGAPLLQPDEELVVRNLEGRATLQQAVDLRGRTIHQISEVCSTEHIQGMVLQRLRYELSVEDTVFYRGESVTGLFSPAALARQTGLDGGEFVPPWLDGQTGRAPERIRVAEDEGLFQVDPGPALAGGRLRLIDEADLVRDGGRYGMGYLLGRRRVSPQDWFFPFHFRDDPVMPGSLGVEAVLQGLQLFVLRSGLAEGPGIFAIPTETPYSWKYRGQIRPTDQELFFDVHVKSVRRDAERIVVVADGNLWKPGMRIYELSDLAVEVRPAREGNRA
ncbi:MAG TPA: hypothetical protein VFG87_24460 [Amycolatopsis sp.]|nr:hypothetical protein [Amycolatopsis sp.]